MVAGYVSYMDERRDWPRFCPTEQTEVRFSDSGGEPHVALMLNESVGGAAFSCPAECAVVPGTIISIDLRGAETQGIVWHSRRDDAGQTVFGVQWLD